MNKNDYRVAIDIFEPDAYLETRIKNSIFAPHRKSYNLKRLIVILGSLILIVSLSFVTAFATSAEFRETVKAIFRIQTPEIVTPVEKEPKVTGPIDIIHSDTIEDTVEIQYIKFKGTYDMGNGVIFSRPDEDKSKVDFYSVENGSLNKIKTYHISTQIAYRNENCELTFDYCVYNGNIVFHQIYRKSDGMVSLYVYPIKNRLDVVMLTLGYGSQGGYSEYKLLLNVKTLQKINFLDGCGVEKLTDAEEISLSDDLSKAIIKCTNGYYFCDIGNKKIVSMNKYLNSKVDSCSFIDNNTLFYTAINNATFNGWSFDTQTNRSKLIFANENYTVDTNGGIKFLGGMYALKIGNNGETIIVNLKNGEKTKIPDYYLTANTDALINSNNTRIMFTKHDYYTNGNSLGIEELGVYDINKHEFSILSREGYETRDEASLMWFDNKRIAVWAKNKNSENYLYLYEFQK